MKMKNKLSLLVILTMLFGFIACKKNNTNTPAIDANPNITVNGISTDLLGSSKAFYTSPLNNDSIVIVNSSVNDSSVFNNRTNINNISAATNYLIFYINYNNTISQITYSASQNVTTYFQVNGNRYKSFSFLPTSITIDTINNSFVSGSYRSQVVNQTNSADVSYPIFTGRFRANR